MKHLYTMETIYTYLILFLIKTVTWTNKTMQNFSNIKTNKNVKSFSFTYSKTIPKNNPIPITHSNNNHKERKPINVYKFGEHESRFQNTGVPEVQIYEKIKDECQKTSTLWKDPLFPANVQSLFYSQTSDMNIEWKRPLDIDADAKFLITKHFRIDYKDAELLKESWFFGAITNLSMNQELLSQVVPPDQNFIKQEYWGVFHFRFWQYGKWVEVVIDDQLPTCKGRLIYMGRTKCHEYWGALLEKAYAKLHGSYEALKGGTIGEAMEDFTGGLNETFIISQLAHPLDLFDSMLKAFEMSSIITCSLSPVTNAMESVTPEGLVRGLNYIVTSVKYVTLASYSRKRRTPLLRLRNIWCKSYEWNGAWSIKSHEWYCLIDNVKEKLGIKIESEGEFWMCFSDFIKYFTNVEICYLNSTLNVIKPERKQVKSDKKNWEIAVFDGQWVKGVSAGGNQNFKETFHYNPQYTVVLNNKNDGDIENKCSLLIGLLQKNSQQLKKMGEVELSIGIAIYQLTKGLSKPLNMLFFQSNPSLLQSPFAQIRQMTLHLKLAPGTYCIIPSTNKPDQEGQFLLRVVSDKKIQIKENEEDIFINKTNEMVMKPLTPQMEQLFLKRRGKNKDIDWRGLKDILDYAMIAGYGGFSKGVCRSMIAMMDGNCSGRLDYYQFQTLWALINKWKDCFELYDKQNRYVLDLSDFRQALHSVGCVINSHILNILVRQYGSTEGYITFDDFILCLMRLRTLTALYISKDFQKTNNVSFSLQEWLQNSIYS